MLGVKCNNEPPQETRTLMAHHLIAVLFSSAWYATSPCIKSTRPVQRHHTTEIHFSYISNAFISPCPTVSLAPPSSPHATALYFSLFIFILCLHLSAPVLTPAPPPPRPPNLFPWLVLSLVQMCPWSAVAWLGDNRSDFETGGMAALLSLTQSYSDEPSTAKGRQRKEK